MIVFVLGTSAEAIKVQPVMRRLNDRGIPFEIWATYQHTEALDASLDSLGLPAPAFFFTRGAKGSPIERPSQMVTWLLSCFRALFKNKKALRRRLGENPLLVVHGDTVTTVFGAMAARILRVPSAHIEAGLRSGNLLRPFPEELDRRIVGKLARVHFAPNAEAAHNLRKKDVVNTLRNTAIDGVLDTLNDEPPALQQPYGLVLLHRFEFISQTELVAQTIETLNAHATVPLVILTDVFSGGAINDALNNLSDSTIIQSQKLPYPEFVNAMANAELVFTDSGGIQQEAGLIGVPTMLHRQVTESPDGMDRNIVLSGWDLEKVRDFLANYQELRRPLERPEQSPSDIIVASLEARGYFSTRD